MGEIGKAQNIGLSMEIRDEFQVRNLLRLRMDAARHLRREHGDSKQHHFP